MTIARRSFVFASAVAVGCVCGAALAKSGTATTPKRLALDSAFGDHGVAAFTSLGTQRLDRFDAIATDALAQHFYVAGSVPGPAVVRFDRRGAPDPTFGTGGVAVLPADGYVNGILALDGIVLYGRFETPAGSDNPSRWGAVRVLTDGSGVDPAFGTGGFLSLESLPTGGEPAALRSVARDFVDGSYVGSVSWTTAFGGAAGLIRFSRDGVIDPSFGGDGFVELESGTVRDVAVDSEGRTVVALEESIQRFNADGTRDMTFGTDGVLLDTEGVVAYPIRLTVAQGDGVVAVVNRTRGGYAVYSWAPDGALNREFGRSGRIDLPLRSGGGIVVPGDFALVPTFDGIPTGDRVLLVGGARFGSWDGPRRHGGWFGELVDASRPRFLRMRAYRDPRTWADESMSMHDVVCTAGRAFAIGNRSTTRTGGGNIDSPFLVSIDLDR